MAKRFDSKARKEGLDYERAGGGGGEIWDLIFSGEPMTGTSNDDFMFGYAVTSAVDNDIDGNLGDDLIIGDIGNFRTLSGAAANGSLATAFDLDSALSAWTAGENALVQGSTILPHITVYVEATAGDDEWFRFSIPTGTGPAAFYIDVDYGVSAIGISTDTVIELYDSAGLLLASNDTSAISNGGFGSSSDQDPFINYTELTGGTFYVRILETVTSTSNFEGGETFLLNISAGAHPASAAAPAGNDTIDGDDDYGDSGQDELFGGAGDDILRGGGGNDFLHGGSGSDDLNGSAGDDVMDGGTGADSMNGTDGNDIYYVDNANDEIGENDVGGSGIDIVYTSVSYALDNAFVIAIETLATTNQSGTGAINLTGNNYTHLFNPVRQTLHGNNGQNILRGEGGDDALNGYGGHDTLEGGTGADILDGGTGNDNLIGGTGADVMTGGVGDDEYNIDNAGDSPIEAVGGGNDTIYSSISYTLGAGREFEVLSTTVQAGTASLTFVGNEFNQTLYGNAGNNYLDGASGIDTLVGFGGNDSYVVDGNEDYVAEFAGGGNDTIYVRGSFILGSGQEVETLAAFSQAGTAAIVIVGNNIAQRLFGNAGNNYLDGDGGADLMVGFAGNDTYLVDNAGDYVAEAAGEGNDIVYTKGGFELTAEQEIETLAAFNQSGTGAIDLIGNALANTIYANNGANTIDGGGGNDVLQGFGGADRFQFTTALGAGNADTIADFQSGIDKLALDDAIFAGIGTPGSFNASAFRVGTAAQDADDRIVYNSGTGQLFFDADGNGAGAAVLFATLSGAPLLIASDFAVI